LIDTNDKHTNTHKQLTSDIQAADCLENHNNNATTSEKHP